MSGNSRRNWVILKIEGFYRRLFIRYLSNKKKSFLVTEFPKSGGSWLTKMLSELLEVDFPQNRFPVNRVSAFQGHYLTSSSLDRVIVLWRDPRDIMISWYFHTVIGNQHSNPKFVESVRGACGITDPGNVSENLDRFLEYCFSGKMSPGFTWNHFFDAWYGNDNVLFVSYEELREAPNSTLKNLLGKLNKNVSEDRLNQVVDKYSFERMTGRKAGDQDPGSFIRKGVVGDWRNYFNEESLKTFNFYVGDRVSLLGYEHV